MINVTVYSYIMGKTEKLLSKANNNPSGFALSEFATLMKRCGWIMDHQTGSHQIWISQRGFRLPIQPHKDGKAKAYQVRQFLKQYEEENQNE
jgi:predicted RNA binding protein YcfA (HicA-like mRNA interferase family)